MSFRKFSLPILCICLSGLFADRAVSADSIADVVSALEARSASAATLRVQFLSTGFECNEAPQTYEQFRSALNEMSIAPHEQFLMDLIRTFDAELIQRHAKHDQSTGHWELIRQATLVDDGVRQRNSSETMDHAVVDGLHLMYTKLKRGQVDAYEVEATSHYFYNRSWLLGEIPLSAFETETPIHSVTDDGETVVVKVSEYASATFDSETMCPLEVNTYDPESGFGRVRLFLLPTTYPGDVTVPAIHLEAEFAKGVLSSVEATAILEAEFNLDVPAESFELPVRKGAMMVDHRFPDRPAKRLDKGIDDAAEFFKATALVRRPMQQDGHRWGWKSILLIANGVILISFGVYCWRRVS